MKPYVFLALIGQPLDSSRLNGDYTYELFEVVGDKKPHRRHAKRRRLETGNLASLSQHQPRHLGLAATVALSQEKGAWERGRP